MTARSALLSGILVLAAAAPATAQERADPDETRRRRIEVIVPRHREFYRLDQDQWRFHAPRFRVQPRLRVREPRLREFAWEDARRRRDELRFRMQDRVERLRDHQLDRADQVRRRNEALSERRLERRMERSDEVRRRVEVRRNALEERVRARRDRYRAI